MSSVKTQTLLYFILNTVSWCYNSRKYDHSRIGCVISAKCWSESKIMEEILNKFEDAVNVEPDYCVCCGLLMIIASLAAFASFDITFNAFFKQQNVSNIMHCFVVRYSEYL